MAGQCRGGRGESWGVSGHRKAPRPLLHVRWHLVPRNPDTLHCHSELEGSENWSMRKLKPGLSPRRLWYSLWPWLCCSPILVFLATRPLPSENCFCSLWSFLPQPLPTFTSESVSSYFPKVPFKSTLSTAQIGRDRKKTCFSSSIELWILQRLSLNLCCPSVQLGFSGILQGWRLKGVKVTPLGVLGRTWLSDQAGACWISHPWA